DKGELYVFEVNPLPGMTPDYSDLVLISRAAGLTYDQLVAEIMAGGLRRLREKRREEREEEAAEAAAVAAASAGNGNVQRPNGNGSQRGNGDAAAKEAAAKEAAAKVEVG